MKKLFVSFTGVLRDLRYGRLNLSDLRGPEAFFAFGCSWNHAHHPEQPIGKDPCGNDIISNEVAWMWGDSYTTPSEEGVAVHAALMEIVDQADLDGRTFWWMDERVSRRRVYKAGPAFAKKISAWTGAPSPKVLAQWTGSMHEITVWGDKIPMGFKVHPLR